MINKGKVLGAIFLTSPAVLGSNIDSTNNHDELVNISGKKIEEIVSITKLTLNQLLKECELGNNIDINCDKVEHVANIRDNYLTYNKIIKDI